MLALEEENSVNLKIQHIPLFQNLLHQIKPASTSDETRVLIELGNQDLESVIPFFQKALLSQQANLQWTALKELIEVGKNQPQRICEILNQTVNNDLFLRPIESTRILIEVGKKDPQSVISIFEKILESANANTQWSAILELSELVKIHPTYFAPFLSNAIKSEHAHVQWCAILATVDLARTRPELAEPIIQEMLDDDIPISIPGPSNLVNIDPNSPDISFALLKSAINSQDSELEWKAMLEIINHAQEYPDKVIPILEQAIENENPHVQWLASLELLELAKNHPEFLSTTLPETTLSNAAPRVLVEYGKENLNHVLPLLEYAMQSDDYRLQCAATLELAALGQIAPEKIVQTFEQFFNQTQSDQKFEKTRVLVELGCTDTKNVIQLLKLAISSEKTALKYAALKELTELIKLDMASSILDEIEKAYKGA